MPCAPALATEAPLAAPAARTARGPSTDSSAAWQGLLAPLLLDNLLLSRPLAPAYLLLLHFPLPLPLLPALLLPPTLPPRTPPTVVRQRHPLSHGAQHGLGTDSVVVCARQRRRAAAGHAGHVGVGSQRELAGESAEHGLLLRSRLGRADADHHVETAGAEQCWIQHVGAVGRAEHEEVIARGGAIELGHELGGGGK
eukprot:scaffold649_cov88-Isochrysis_galbana.AAC.2